jgi:ABC-type multidrug transport system fused ATPase/permease subunit
MKIRIPFIPSLVHYFKIFYSYSGNKILILFLFILGSGLCEGLGISLLIPLLEVQNTQSESTYSRYIFNFMEYIGLEPNIFSLMILLLALFSLKALFMVAKAVVSQSISTAMLLELRNTFCYKYTRVKYEYFINKKLGYFNNLITTESTSAISGLKSFISVIITIVFIGIYCAGSLVINPELTLIVFAACIILFCFLKRISRYLQKLSALVTQTNADVQSLLIQKLNYFKYLKSTNSFTPVLNQVKEKTKLYKDLSFKTGVISEMFQPIAEYFTLVVILLIIGYYVGLQETPIQEIFILLLFLYRTLLRILQLQSAWQRFSVFTGAVNVIHTEGQSLNSNQEQEDGVALTSFNESIELHNVDFHYGERQALFNINMVIPKNKSVGIVGPSGSGKTTLFDLLTGLLAPTSGVISIDGMDYRKTDIASLRLMLGYVTQEPVIFDDTIANNISFWSCSPENPECLDRIKKAAKIANCTSFVNECEKGYDTNLGEKGVRLSGGQRQRIAIAREAFKNPQLTIFDEATSSLDTESEQHIQKSIDNMMGTCTIVIIAHRLSTIRNCDLIYVMDSGRIVEQGSYDELYNDTNSQFRAMCRAQHM